MAIIIRAIQLLWTVKEFVLNAVLVYIIEVAKKNALVMKCNKQHRSAYVLQVMQDFAVG